MSISALIRCATKCGALLQQLDPGFEFNFDILLMFGHAENATILGSSISQRKYVSHRCEALMSRKPTDARKMRRCECGQEAATS
ncbi:uncharacterized protein PHALS_09221 [Plasmopara halstedii]|uniref:Uncharacterized protein n=1 Tax=Plasmopara halstedii TaxID=4781 RepID=A0A0P1ADZ7_PLAHL|nr:uncharacterized protein PHALS_09221 [Plasmopara halstedii]CEG39166.1 hypothetical protein PHALS_09221 [Plasmopara halstedii]|eukprot:XP_024575535.1 hypothetical protein PHALS_09221 [Plasmopara halstedii]